MEARALPAAVAPPVPKAAACGVAGGPGPYALDDTDAACAAIHIERLAREVETDRRYIGLFPFFAWTQLRKRCCYLLMGDGRVLCPENVGIAMPEGVQGVERRNAA
eukprot:15449380-Alexandrium_andersonii.AAC.1